MISVVSSKNGSSTAVRGIGHQHHVGLVDALPAGDRRAVEHLAVVEKARVDRVRRHGDVLLLAARVREAQVDELDLLLLQHAEDFSGRRHEFSSG